MVIWMSLDESDVENIGPEKFGVRVINWSGWGED